MTLTAAEYERLCQNGDNRPRPEIKTGKAARFPPEPTRNGYRYYIPSAQAIEDGMKVGIYCGAGLAEKSFPRNGQTWGTITRGYIFAYSTLDEAAAAYFRQHPGRWMLQVWK